MNQTIDKILYPSLAPDKATAMQELGIYGANYKIAIVMVMFIQAFRFAYEPYIFARDKESGRSGTSAYSEAMKYFVIFALCIFLGVMFYIDIIKYFISPKYFSGLKVVPVVMLGEFFFGVFFNLSVWYKLTDKTLWGMWFSLLGLAVTLVLNVLLVPRFGYMGCAWAAFCCYGVMMVTSYFIGQRRYPISYHAGRLAVIFAFAMALYGVSLLVATRLPWVNMLIRTPLLVVFIAVVMKMEHISPRSLIPSRRHA